MTREQAINSMISHGFKVEQVGEIIKAVTPPINSEILNNSTTKNNLGVDYRSLEDIKKLVERKADALDGVMLDAGGAIIGLYFAIANDLPSVTPQLSVPEVTALAEWTTKLTKASEDAYNKGYAEVLDKIRAEIEGLTYYWCETNPKNVIDDVLEIIDKYKAESED